MRLFVKLLLKFKVMKSFTPSKCTYLFDSLLLLLYVWLQHAMSIYPYRPCVCACIACSPVATVSGSRACV